MTADRDAETTGAQPSLGRLACLVPGLLIAIALAVGGGLALVNCLRASPATSYATRVDALPVETPVFLSGPGIYLVRLPGGVVALDQDEPGQGSTGQRCIIRYRETLEAAGRRGLFRSDCTGALYGLDGAPLEGTSPSMIRHSVERDGDMVTVDFESCISPGAANAVVRCRSR